MPTADDVIVEFEARVSGYEADLKRAARTFDQTTKVQEARMAAFERRIKAGVGRIGAALGGLATLATAREFLRLVDASKQIEAQLRLATRESGNFGQAQEDVRRIAMQTRSGLEETANLYAVFQRDSAALGITQLEAARATETLTKSFVISGASAAETTGATRQLIQGLQSGTLRGDEFNSVMEQAPRLQKLFAAALGVSKGELRGMAEDGKITAAALVDALTNTKFTKGIDAEFRELPVTFDQAMQQVETAATITFGAFDRGGGFSQMLSNFFMDGADGFADLEQAAVETGIDIRSTFEGLANVFEPLVDAARSAFGEIGGEAMTLADRIRPLLSDIDSITGYMQDNGYLPWIVNKLGGNMSLRTNLLGRFNEAQAQAEAQRRGALAEQALADMWRGYDVMGNRVAPAATSGGGGSSGSKKPNRRRDPSAETLAARAERERLAAIREEGEKQRDLLDLQDDLIAARAALATAAEDVARFELQQLGNEQAARLSELQTQKRLGELSQQEYDIRAAALAEEIDLRRQGVERQRDEAVADRDLRQQQDMAALQSDALLAQADIADTLDQRRLLENSALAIQQEIERALLEQAIAEGRIADAAEARRLLAERQSAETTGQERRNQGPLADYLDSTKDPKTRAEQAAVRELENVRDGLAEGLAEQLGTKNEFVKSLFSIFLDQVIFRPLAETLRDAGGGGLLGGLFSFASGLLGGGGGSSGVGRGARAIGGPVRAGVPYVTGENGRELFVPQQNGVIVPNHRLSPTAAGTTVISAPQYDLRGAMVTEHVLAELDRRSRMHASEAYSRAVSTAARQAPGAVRSAQRYGSGR